MRSVARTRSRRRPTPARTLPDAVTGIAVVGIALIGIAGCGPAGEPAAPADAVARVGSIDLSYEEFSAYVERQVGESGGALPSDVLTGLLDRFLDEQLLALDAAERDLTDAGAPPGVAAEALMEWLASQDLGVTAADVEAYYAEHREEFERPERVRLHQALFDDREAAERARTAIAGGEPFAEVAARLATEGSGAGGLTLPGELARDELPPSFAEVIFRLEPGEVSEVVEAEYGFHLFTVRERMPAAVLPLADARDEIRRHLESERADRRLAEMVAAARRRYNVIVFGRNLPFNYQGRYVSHSA